MRIHTSTFCILCCLLLVSGAIVGVLVSCDEKEIDPPVVGSSAGTGPVGGGDAQNLALTASPSETITVTEGDQGSVTITARVENNIGQPMPDGTNVQWTNTVGTLDNTSSTTSSGLSSVTLTFPTSYTGCSTVTASAGDASDSIQVCVKNVVPTATPTLTPTTAPTTTPNPTATPSKIFMVSSTTTSVGHKGTATITATALTNGQPDANIQVNFTVSGSGLVNPGANYTNNAGQATTEFTGNHSKGPGCAGPPANETATVTATTADGRSGSVTIIVTCP